MERRHWKVTETSVLGNCELITLAILGIIVCGSVFSAATVIILSLIKRRD